MLESLYIDNYKSFNDFSIDFDKVTVIIGNNAVGKSSLLQALVFLRDCCLTSAQQFLSDRGMSVEDIVSKMSLSNKRTITFRATFSYSSDVELIWEIKFITEKSKNNIKLVSESVIKKTIIDMGSTKEYRTQLLLNYDSKRAYRVNRSNDEENIALGDYRSSQISFLDEKRSDEFPELYFIKKFFIESEPLDLLSPARMRSSSRGALRTLGDSGNRLPALIKLLNLEERERLLTLINKDVESISSISASVKKAGWTYLETEEKYKDRSFRISSSNVSDGTLRLLAVYALEHLGKKGGMTILDEIEDGINIDNLKNVTTFLEYYANSCDQQVLVTTHNTVLLDYIKADNIRFFHKDENGNTICNNFLDSLEIKKQLKYLYPGEIVLNISNADLVDMMTNKVSEPLK